MSWAAEDLKYKICKLQEFGILSALDFFPWYTEFVWPAQSSILFAIDFYNEICKWLRFFFIFSSFSVSIFWQKFQVQFGALCYALDICVLKSGVKIQDACLNNTVSPAELASDVRGDGASLCFSHHTSCSTFGHVMWVVLWKKNNKQVQDVMSDLVNQCTRNTLP